MPRKKKKEPVLEPQSVDSIMSSIDDVSDGMGLAPANLLTGGFLQGSIPTGSWALDLIIGGGWPRSKWSTITGWEGSGKSTILYEAGASAQMLGIPILIFDHEGSFDASYCKAIGFDLEDKHVRIYQPETGEFTFRFLNRLLKTLQKPVVDRLYPQVLVLVDSLASMTPEDQQDDDEKNAMSSQARMFSIYIRLIKGQLASKGVSLLATNQLREKPMQMYGSPEYEPGGNAVKFYPDLKLRIRRKGGKAGLWVEDGFQTMLSTATTLKNKGFPPFQDAELYIHMGGGFAPVRDRLFFMTMTGMLQKNFNCKTGETTKGTDSFIIPGWENDKTIVRGDPQRLAACHDSVLDDYIKAHLESGKAFSLYRQLKGLYGSLIDQETGEMLEEEEVEEPIPDDDPEYLAEKGSQEPMEKAEQAIEEVINNDN